MGQHEFLGDEGAHGHCNQPDRSTDHRVDEFGGVGDHLRRGERGGILGGADSPVVEGDTSVTGGDERRNLMDVPGSARTGGAGHEQHRIAGADVVVGQGAHPREASSAKTAVMGAVRAGGGG